MSEDGRGAQSLDLHAPPALCGFDKRKSDAQARSAKSDQGIVVDWWSDATSLPVPESLEDGSVVNPWACHHDGSRHLRQGSHFGVDEHREVVLQFAISETDG